MARTFDDLYDDLSCDKSLHKTYTKKIKGYQDIGIPILMYGKKQYAGLLSDYLKNNNVLIDDYFTDDDFDPDDNCMNFEDACEKHNFGFVLVIGFLTKESVKSKVKEMDGGRGIIKDYFHYGHPYPYVGEGEAYIDQDFIKEKKELLRKAYDCLSDELSKQTFYSYLKTKITDDVSYINTCFRDNQYFPKDILRFSSDEVVVDAGAFDGDVLSDYVNQIGHFDSYYAYEPDPRFRKDLISLKNKLDTENIYIIPKALSDEVGYLSYSLRKPRSSGVDYTNSESSLKIEKTTIDTDLNNVTFLKMDIEGSEYLALLGAKKIISNNKPKLAIACYHKSEDIFKLPILLKELCPEYKLFLRQHEWDIARECILYATL